MASIHDAFTRFLSESAPLGEGGYIDASHPRAKAMVAVEEAIRASIADGAAGLEVEGSVGKGSAAKVPWVAVLDPRAATSTQEGIYVVYLFQENFNGVFATLNQGVTRLRKTKGAVEARAILSARARQIRPRCEALVSRGFSLDNSVDLATDSPLGGEYQTSTIAHRYYPASALPAEPELQADLLALLHTYELVVRDADRRPPPTAEPNASRATESVGGTNAEPADKSRFSYLLAVLESVARERPQSVDDVRACVNAAPRALVQRLGRTVENYAEAFNQRNIGVPRDEFFALVLSALRGDSGPLERQIRSVGMYAEYLRQTPGAEERLRASLSALEGVRGGGPGPSGPEAPPRPPLPPAPPTVGLAEAVPMLHRALMAAGWVFEPWQLAAYVTALRTKPFVILGGVSGTGKSQLPRLVNSAFGAAAAMRISVRPDWTDSSDLLGYRDLTNRFRPGALAQAALDAKAAHGTFHVAIVDEMNIARVEHYFAEVLSAIEDLDGPGGASGRLLGKQLEDGLDPEWLDLRIPPNMAIVGTVNMDESTFGFSRKVIDRAFTLELSSSSLAVWETEASDDVGLVPVALESLLRKRRRLAELRDADEKTRSEVNRLVTQLEAINQILAPAQLHLGYRSRDEIVLFVLNAAEIADCFVLTATGAPAANLKVDPFDLALLMKVLPRFSGGSRAVQLALARLLCWASDRPPGSAPDEAATKIRDAWREGGSTDSLGGSRYPRTAARLALMWDRMKEEGFTSYWI